MKKIYFTLLYMLFVALYTVLLAAGCEKKQEDCGCYAPSGTEVSWSEYNNVEALHAYFDHHDSTLLQHIGDTIRLCGWAYYPDNEAGEPRYAVQIPDWSPYGGTMFLVDNEDHHCHNGHIAYVRWPQQQHMLPEDSAWYEEHAGFVDHFAEYLPKKWYVTARIECIDGIFASPCDNYEPRYRLIALDTIKKIKS